jgi:pyruvate,water dikinase
MAPISGDTITQHLAGGFTRAIQEFGGPVALQSRQVNFYPYHRMSPVPPQGETEVQRTARYEKTMTETVLRIGELWEKEWLPYILPPLERARDMDYSSLSDAGLWAEFQTQLSDSADRWWIHGKLNYVLVAASQFADFYNEHIQPDNEVEAYEVLQGFETLSLAQGRGLWRLSRLLKQSDVLEAIFAETPVEQLEQQLGKSPEGLSFLKSLREYLEEFGWRSDSIYDIGAKPWREDPQIPLGTIKGYAAMGDEGDPDLEFRRSVARREELLKSARETLGHNEALVQRFDELYEAARHNLAVTEDHNYYIDCLGVTVLRLPLLEFGRRLVGRGLLNEADDAFMLHLRELEAAVLQAADYRSTVLVRREEMQRAAETVPPATIGTPEPMDLSDPFAQAMLGRMIGLIGFEPSDEPSVVKGIAGSAGVARGVAKVVRSLAEASKLQPGDIMVCEMTTPPWTPLFSTIAALVADTGGVLSHCALVAREYRLPAVVGTQVGTQVIRDGMLISVDGTQGIVRIESAPTEPPVAVEYETEAATTDGTGIGGEWELAWDTPMGHIDAVLTLQANGKKVTGILDAEGVTQEIRDGRAKDNSFSFKASAQTPMGKLNLTFDGAVEGDQMSGSIKAMMMKMAFAGTRRA